MANRDALAAALSELGSMSALVGILVSHDEERHDHDHAASGREIQQRIEDMRTLALIMKETGWEYCRTCEARHIIRWEPSIDDYVDVHIGNRTLAMAKERLAEMDAHDNEQIKKEEATAEK